MAIERQETSASEPTVAHRRAAAESEWGSVPLGLEEWIKSGDLSTVSPVYLPGRMERLAGLIASTEARARAEGDRQCAVAVSELVDVKLDLHDAIEVLEAASKAAKAAHHAWDRDESERASYANKLSAIWRPIDEALSRIRPGDAAAHLEATKASALDLQRAIDVANARITGALAGLDSQYWCTTEGHRIVEIVRGALTHDASGVVIRTDPAVPADRFVLRSGEAVVAGRIAEDGEPEETGKP